MEQIDKNTVQYTSDGERKADDYFNELLDKGYSILDAVELVKKWYSNLDPAFYAWLSE
jgi:CRISPR/Cas system-associated endonuclease Cas1